MKLRKGHKGISELTDEEAAKLAEESYYAEEKSIIRRQKALKKAFPRMPDHEVRATVKAEDLLSDADSLIARYLEDGAYEDPIAEEDLISELDCIRSELDDCEDDGWAGYRDAMDSLSNRLWKIGVAWPQSLPYWSWADVVLPKDLKREISETALYRDDLLAIRSFSDVLKCRFKEAVHILVEHARKTIAEFPKPQNSRKKARDNTSRKKARRPRFARECK